MNQEIESPKYPNRRAHRNYMPEFKVQLISVCKQDAASTAALALSHGMNANVLHRWLKEHERSGRHCLAGQPPSNSPKLPAFIPLPLPGKAPEKLPHMSAQELREVVQSLFKTLTFKQALIDKLTFENAYLKRQKFAPQSERYSAEQRSFLEETLDADLQVVNDEIEQLTPTDTTPKLKRWWPSLRIICRCTAKRPSLGALALPSPAARWAPGWAAAWFNCSLWWMPSKQTF